jgi:hypothetical protein
MTTPTLEALNASLTDMLELQQLREAAHAVRNAALRLQAHDPNIISREAREQVTAVKIAARDLMRLVNDRGRALKIEGALMYPSGASETCAMQDAAVMLADTLKRTPRHEPD